MQVLVSITVALILWIVAWTFGIKALDAFLAVLAIALVSLTARLVSPYIRQQLGR